MPEKKTMQRARKAKRQGKAPSTQAGEFVREEIEHVREGKHGARNTKQAIAIGLSKARRAGVKLPVPKKGTTSSRTRKQAARDLAKGSAARRKPNPKRSRATKKTLEREDRVAASPRALSRQAKSAAARRRARSTARRPASSSRATTRRSAKRTGKR
ncbi:MAG: transcription elongation factor [Labilithrix sp.]|nr:transcription elongation factor [Labilithrix sp.]